MPQITADVEVDASNEVSQNEVEEMAEINQADINNDLAFVENNQEEPHEELAEINKVDTDDDVVFVEVSHEEPLEG